jgi:hypothetical protein
MNIREWANSYETMDPTDKSNYSAKRMWDLIMHGILPYVWPTEIRGGHIQPSLVDIWKNIKDIRRARMTAEIK